MTDVERQGHAWFLSLHVTVKNGARSRKCPAAAAVLMRADLYLLSTPVNVNTRGHFIVRPLPADSRALSYGAATEARKAPQSVSLTVCVE